MLLLYMLLLLQHALGVIKNTINLINLHVFESHIKYNTVTVVFVVGMYQRHVNQYHFYNRPNAKKWVHLAAAGINLCSYFEIWSIITATHKI